MIRETLAQYRDLQKRVDEKFAEIHRAQAEHMACRSGCHSCCKPDLTLSLLEAEAIRSYLAEHPETAARAQQAEAEDPFRGKRCSFLAATGDCTIYEARPLVCRSHGLPLQFSQPAEPETKIRDACELNFATVKLGELPSAMVLNQDTIHMLLALLNKRAFGKKLDRVPLKPSALVNC